MKKTIKKVKRNIFKGIITTIIGIVTMLISLQLLYSAKIDFVWSGLAGLAIGTVLLLAPDQIITNFVEIAGKFTTTKRKESDDDTDTDLDITEDFDITKNK